MHPNSPVSFRLSLSLFAVCTVAVVANAANSLDREAVHVVVKSQGYVPFADAPINYRSNSLADPIAELQKRLEAGMVNLHYDPKFGYLRSVLDLLRIPVSSQTLVFSKTSFQFTNISPAHPRALYFNDDVYAGRVHSGKFLEFVSFDPMQGAVFYVMDEHQVARPRFERAVVDCVQCHVAPATRGVPGVFVRSIFTNPSGYQAPGTQAFVTGHESPLDQKWGGWYVTASSGIAGSMANVTVSDRAHPEQLDRTAGENLTRLDHAIDTSDYLTGSSDAVALLVLAHQTQMHNLITQTNYQVRLSQYQQQTQIVRPGVASARTIAESEPWTDVAEKLLRYLLFTNEAPLAGEIKGDSAFASEFATRGPRDPVGRSLRDFDLRTRLFKYRCSYLIYSSDFDALPSPAKEYIFRRLLQILTGRDTSGDFSLLSAEERRAIFEILVDTKPGLPGEWKQLALNRFPETNIRAGIGAGKPQP